MSISRVLGYVRLSNATEESTSVTRQRQIIEQTCAARGWELVGYEEDVDVSASKRRLDRPGLNSVRRRIAAGEADAVVAWRLDRIARSVVDFGTLLDEGLQIVSATEPLDTTSSMGRAMAEILQVFAAMESRAIGARVASTRKHLSTVGRFPGGLVPFGYKPVPNPDGPGRILIVDQREAAIVRELAERILDGRDSLPTVTTDLTARGIPTTRSAYRTAERAGRDPEGLDRGKWQITSLSIMMTGDALLGRVKHHTKLVIGPDGMPSDVWPAILDLDTLQRLRDRVGDPRKPSMRPRRTRVSRLLSSMVACGLCGSMMHLNADPRSGASYRCSGPVNGIPCSAPRITAEGLEEYVTDRFLAFAGPLQEVSRVEEYEGNPEADAALREIEAALAETAQEFVSPGADLAALSRRVETLHARKAELGEQPLTVTVREVPTGRTLAEAWLADEDLVERRALLSSAIDHVEIAARSVRGPKFDESRVTIRWQS